MVRQNSLTSVDDKLMTTQIETTLFQLLTVIIACFLLSWSLKNALKVVYLNQAKREKFWVQREYLSLSTNRAKIFGQLDVGLGGFVSLVFFL